MRIDGSRILITGASSGIGAALAPELAKRGATLAIVARRANRLEQVLEACREHAPASCMFAADLGDLDMAESVVAKAWETLGHLDALVNNAAIPSRVRVWNLSREELEQVMRIDFTSPVRMAMSALERMRTRGSGLIVNVSSVGGRLGIGSETAYCAAKFALCGWSEAAAIDLADEPIDVKLIIPGPIDTEIWDIETPEPADYDGPMVPAIECAIGIAHAIEGDGFEYYVPDMKHIIVGKSDNVDGFLAGAAAMARQARDKA